MQAILIPPVPCLEWDNSSLHLTLVHLYQVPEYYQFYSSLSPHHYIIIDNGAHEKQSGERIRELWNLGIGNELVLPDYLFRSQETLQLTSQALSEIPQLARESGRPPLNYMIVPQGRSPGDYIACLENLLQVYDQARHQAPDVFTNPPVLGVSKDYEIWPGGLLRLLRKILKYRRHLLDIHLLGWGRDLWALRDISLNFGEVIRSIDSTKPFVYARAGISLDPSQPPPPYPGRSPTHFTDPMTESQLEVLAHNVAVFRSLLRPVFA